MEINAGYKQTEIGVIPEDWNVYQFDDLGQAIIGLTYSPNDVSSSGKLVHRSSNIQNNRLAFYDNVYVSSTIPEKLILRNNDILICVRNGSKQLIGKSVLIKGKSIGETFGAFMSVFRPRVYAPLLYQYFISNIVQHQITASLGATINQITNKTLNEFLTPFPPTLKEQKAIATALSDVDNLITNLDHLITKKKAIKQGAMQRLLTPPHLGGKRLSGFDGEWVEKSLGSVVNYKNGAAHENCVVKNGDFVIVNSKFVSTEGRVVKYSDENRCPVNKDEILMVLSDVPNGKAIAKCYYVETDDKYTLNQRICSFKTDRVDPKFLFLILNRNPYYLKFDDGVKQTNLRNEDVLSCPLWLPPTKEEQQAISEIIHEMNIQIESLETKKQKYQGIKQGMMQELLTGKTRLV
jgi:type I restriction enzyme S subunit